MGLLSWMTPWSSIVSLAGVDDAGREDAGSGIVQLPVRGNGAANYVIAVIVSWFAFEHGVDVPDRHVTSGTFMSKGHDKSPA